jgi:chlorobactene glucosyltransferase
MSWLWLEQQAGVAAFLAVLVAIALWNRRVLKRPGGAKLPARWPRVSLLVPARNEQDHISGVVESLAGQDYPDFEVLVLDDGSSDRTPELLRELAGRFPNLRVLEGKPLPRGWLGKHWACHQLAEAATGEVLLFTDADTRHRVCCLRETVARFEADQLDLLTGVPREEVVSWAEKLVVPVVPWAILSFLPLGLAYRRRWPAFTAANGQFMMFRRQAYDDIGGHAMVRDNVVDDLALVRLLAKRGGRWRLFDLTGLVSCRMYRSAAEVFDGFSKNLFGAFGFRLAPFLFVWLWLAVVHLQPLAVIGRWAAGGPTSAYSAVTALAAVGLALVLWGSVLQKFRFPVGLALLYPVSVVLAVGVAARSVWLHATRRARWKGRRVG